MPFARNTAWGLAGSIVSGIAASGSTVWLARWLSPEAHGQVQAALSLLTVLSFGAQIGVVAATIHRVARAGSAPRLVVSTALASVTGTGVSVALILALLREPVSSTILVGLPPAGLLLVLATVIPLLWMQVLGGAARALDRFGDWTLAQASHQVLRLVALLIVASLAPAGAVVALGAVWLGQSGTTALVALRVLPGVGLTWRLRWPELREMTGFGLRTYAHTLAGQVHERLDLVLLAILDGDPAHLAAYAVAVGVVNRLRMLPLAMSAALFPRIAALADDDGARFTAGVCRHAVLWTIALGLLLALIAPVGVPLLFGPAYTASIQPLWILLPGTVALSVYLVLGRWFQAIDAQGINLASQVLGIGVNLILNLWWIPGHGLVGAASASLVSYGLQAVLVSIGFLRRGRVGFGRTFIAGRSDLRWYLDRIQRLG